MTTALKIKDVAERSGFSTATLRYYEEIGLMPAPERTPAGYRVYTDQAVARLAFIARAKQLGCSLDEIGDLATAWRWVVRAGAGSAAVRRGRQAGRCPTPDGRTDDPDRRPAAGRLSVGTASA